MRKIIIASMMTILLILLVTGCDDRNPTDTSTSLSISTNRDTLHVGASINTCDIHAAITKDGNAIEGAQVNFSATMGEVLQSGITNIYGIAETTFYYTGTETGIATVYASYAGLDDELNIHIVDEHPFILEVWAAPDTIYLGSGQYSTDIHVHLTDRDNVPLQNQGVTLEVSDGFITPSVVTNLSGYADAVYIFSGNEEGFIEIRATYMGDTAISFIQIYELDVINLEVWADPDTIFIGTSANSSEIYARLTNAYGAPITDVQVNFDATMGSILNHANTNSNGIANSSFWYSERPDMIAVITAEYLGITENVAVTILSDQPQIVFLEADPLIIYNDNDPDTYSLITTHVVDSAGSPAPGLVVSFSTTIGYMQQPYAETDEEGYATSRLQDDGIPGVATVYVNCVNDQSQIDVHILPR
jgi:hypothetical protein